MQLDVRSHSVHHVQNLLWSDKESSYVGGRHVRCRRGGTSQPLRSFKREVLSFSFCSLGGFVQHNANIIQTTSSGGSFIEVIVFSSLPNVEIPYPAPTSVVPLSAVEFFAAPGIIHWDFDADPSAHLAFDFADVACVGSEFGTFGGNDAWNAALKHGTAWWIR